MNSSEPAVSQLPGADTAPACVAPKAPSLPGTGTFLALQAVLLAGLQMSTPAHNKDLWQHLAAGRSLAAGQVPALDPTLDVPPGAVPALTSWLYDLCLYAGFRLLGGTGVVALFACLATLLVVFVFLSGRSRTEPTFAAVAALLASVALGPWLGLHSGLVSCLFLAVTLLLLGRVALAAEGELGPTRAWWLLPVLVVLWANADGWVVLGPLAIGLGALGERTRGRIRAARALGALFLVTVAASLVSPNHVRVWADLPTLLRGDPAWGPVVSPFWPAWFRTGPPAAAVAFYALSALGLLAIAVERRGPAWTLAPLWMVLLGLAAWRPAEAAFFAVAAGSPAALGLAVLARLAPVGRRLASLARGLALLAGVLLVAAAWPGWLQGQPPGRRVWSVEADESLREGVEEIVRWRQMGALGTEARGLTLSPEAAAYWAWFGPGERPTPDVLPSPTGTDFAAVWQGLLGGGRDWREVLRRRHIRYLILANSADDPVAAVVTRLAAAPDEWPLLYLRGRTIVFGWRDPEKAGAADPFAALKLDLEQRAFHPTTADRAPAEGPTSGPGQRPWWWALVEPPPTQSVERDEAALYLAFFDAQRPRYQERATRIWLGWAGAGLVGGLVDPARGPAAQMEDLALRLAWVRLGWGAYAASQDDGPPGLPLLAIRAARRALHDNPDDARSYFLLGESYLRLGQATRERDWRHQLPPFDRIRQVQSITAFTQALALRPDSPGAHGRLARLYRDSGALDLALPHLGKLVEATRARGARQGESNEAFREGLDRLEEEKTALEQEVRQRETAVREAASGGSTLNLAREAASRGLPGFALQVLLKSDASEFGPEGSKLELELLLWAGRVQDVREWLISDMKGSLGATVYHEIRARVAAATGHYDEAGQELGEIAALLQRGSRGNGPAREEVASNVACAVLQASILDQTPAVQIQTSFFRQALLREIHEDGESLGREANAHVVRGLIALEAGQVEEAGVAMRRAMATWKSAADAAVGSGIDFSGRRAAQQSLGWISR